MLAIVLSALAVFALIVIGACSAAILRIRSGPEFVVAAGVCAAAIAVGASISLSLVSAWTRAAVFTILIVVAAAVVTIWMRVGQPRPVDWPTRDVWRGLKGQTGIVLGFAAITLLLQAYVGARFRPGNWDSMTYHLSRAAYWLQYHAISQYPGASIRQAASAPNGEILQGLTMMFAGTDKWVASIQWLSLVGTGLIIYSGARFLTFARDESLFAGALFILLPQPVMQAVTTQNDLIEAFFFCSATFFFVRGLRDRNRGDSLVAALALALAVGTKGTAFIAGTALIFLILAVLMAYRPPVRFVLASVASVVMATALIGSYNYILNVEHRGGVLGGVQAQTVLTGPRLPNSLRALSTFADTPGISLGWLNTLTSKGTKLLVANLAPTAGPLGVDSSVQEDTSSFGLVGFLVLPLLLTLVLLGRRQPLARRLLAGSVVLYLVVFAASVANNPWLGRLLIPAVALAAPLFAVLGKRPALAGATVVLAVMSLVPALTQNVLKPLTPSAAFQKDRWLQMSIARPEMYSVLISLDAYVGRREPIAFVGGEDSWDYPFFGEGRQRRIVRYTRPGRITSALLRHERVAGAVFANVGHPPAGLSAKPLGPDYWWVRSAP